MAENVYWTTDRAAVADYMNHAPKMPHLSAVDLVREYARSQSSAAADLSRRYPTWSAEQLQSLNKFSNFFFHSTEAIARGIARRIAFDSPLELATFLSFIARYQWSFAGHARLVPKVERERYFLSILQAVAANDLFVAQRFAQSAMMAPPCKPNVKEYAVLTGGVLALLLGDAGELTKAVAAMDRCKPKAYVAGMFETLRGAANGSAAQVAAGLTMALKAYPKYMLDDPVMRLIDPHVHGLFQLCQRYSADLVSQFDVSRGPPWDPEFHAWWQTDGDPLAGVDLTAIDQEVHRVLIQLQEPIWWGAEESAAW